MDDTKRTTEQIENPSRREALACAGWIGAGVLWTVAAGAPRTIGLIGSAQAADASGFTFAQISDSHIGFKAGPYQNVAGTLNEAIGEIKSLKQSPAFMLHTGDITHLAKADEFDDAEKINSKAGLDIHYVPGEHDMLDPGKKLYLERHGRGTKGDGWYSFDDHGVHFIGLSNVLRNGSDGQWLLGADQLAWLKDDLRGVSSSTPVVAFAHIPLWTIYAKWGWGTGDGAAAVALMRRFGSVTLLNGHIHQIVQKTEGSVQFHTARSTAFPQPVAATAPHEGPILTLPAGEVGKHLGVTTVAVHRGGGALALTDSTLSI